MAPVPPRVLVADDHEDTRELYRQWLTLFERFYVETAADGEEALLKAVNLLPDAVVLDATMPRLDGWEVCAALKTIERTAQIVVIMLTGQSVEEGPGDPRCGADYVLLKPCTPEKLSGIIRKLVRA